MERKYAEFAATKACELLAIDSPSGYTRKAADWVKEAFSSLGFDAQLTTKGGVLVNLGGADEKDALLLEAHTDTLGAMVAEVKANGRLRLTPLGGMRAENAETENVLVHTRTGRIIEGTVQLCNASVHVNGQYGETKRSFDTVEAVLDEDVKTADETRALGVEVGWASARAITSALSRARESRPPAISKAASWTTSSRSACCWGWQNISMTPARRLPDGSTHISRSTKRSGTAARARCRPV